MLLRVLKEGRATSPATFTRKSDLTRHVSSVNKKIRHACHCGATFSQKSHLTVHISSVHGKIRHACHCGATFSVKSALRRHEANVHGGKVVVQSKVEKCRHQKKLH